MVVAEVLPLETVGWEFVESSVKPQRVIYPFNISIVVCDPRCIQNQLLLRYVNHIPRDCKFVANIFLKGGIGDAKVHW